MLESAQTGYFFQYFGVSGEILHFSESAFLLQLSERERGIVAFDGGPNSTFNRAKKRGTERIVALFGSGIKPKKSKVRS